MMMLSSSTLRTASTAVLFSSLVAGSAGADVVSATYASSTSYHYKIGGMTDWDQRRSALPNTGNMYCAPTATMNLFAYAANHGFPGTNPGPGGWYAQSKYNMGSIWLVIMGLNMGTDAEDGTGSGWGPGAAVFASGSLMNTTRYSRTSNYTPTIAKMTQKACQGSIVAFSFGTYRRTGFASEFPLITRTGGHVVTLTESIRTGSSRILRYRDPWTDDSDSLSSQSTYATTEVMPVTKFFLIGGVPSSREVLWEGTGSDGNYYYWIFESFLTLKPYYGLQFSGSGDAPATALESVVPQWFTGSPQPPATFNVPTGHELEDVAFNFDDDEAIVVTKTGSIAAVYVLGRIDLLSGQYTPIPTPIQPVVMCVGRNNSIFISDGGKIHRINQLGETEVATSNTPVVTRMAYNDAADELVVLSIPNRALRRFTEDLGTIATFAVPTAIPMSGQGWLTTCPDTSRIWFRTGGNSNLYGFLFGSGPAFSQQTISGLGLVNPTGLACDDEGRLHVTSQGLRRALKRDPRTNVWSLDPTAPFFGLPGGSQFAMSRSRTNLPPGAEDGPEFVNVELSFFSDEPLEFEDCGGDLNFDDQVTAADLALLLAAWGNLDSPADFDGNGTVDAADLAILLASWGGCP
jgi:hypothetical protein